MRDVWKGENGEIEGLVVVEMDESVEEEEREKEG